MPTSKASILAQKTAFKERKLRLCWLGATLNSRLKLLSTSNIAALD